MRKVTLDKVGCAFAILSAALLGCSSGDGNGGSDGGGSASSGPGHVDGPGTILPGPEGCRDADPGESDLPLSSAKELKGITYCPNRSSVRLYLPVVENAKDFRVFAVDNGVTVKMIDSVREHVDGATLFCSGLRQRNQCNEDQILPVHYNNEILDMPLCSVDGEPYGRRPHVATERMQTLDVTGIGPDTTLIVEALDRQCPFPGLHGSKSRDVAVGSSDIGPPMIDAVVDGTPHVLKLLPDTFPVRTEAQIRAEYGSMILNGQGPNHPVLDPDSPAYPESPFIRIGHPAAPDDPVVLARAIVKVSPTGTEALPEGFTDQDYFDDFEDDSDQPKLVRDHDYTGDFGSHLDVYGTKKWILYNAGTDLGDMFIDRGQLNLLIGDYAQGSMVTQGIYPKRAVELPEADNLYLHVTYEVQRNETARRYEMFSLCGAENKGDTYEGDAPKAGPLPRPGFMNEGDTARTNSLGWNCLTLTPRGAGYGEMEGGTDEMLTHSDTSLKITVVGAHPAPTIAEYDTERVTQYAAAFGPTQDVEAKRWMRQIDASKNISGVWLDDQTNVYQKARFDVFVRRDRVIIYVEGEQRLCQDLTGSPLTMAEGALGLWHIVYHTSAEFIEMKRGLTGDNPSTGQIHLLHNTPFADHRSYDNVGFRENVELPKGFEAARCDPGTQ